MYFNQSVSNVSDITLSYSKEETGCDESSPEEETGSHESVLETDRGSERIILSSEFCRTKKLLGFYYYTKCILFPSNLFLIY